VARVAGRPVGTAIVRWAAGTACLGGIGVAEPFRRRGIGRAVTVAAAQHAAGRPGTDVVWLHATPDGAALYETLGFTLVDTYVVLAGKAPDD
jgi:ribosomal protein S18 acetylase RimI-like enzyme